MAQSNALEVVASLDKAAAMLESTRLTLLGELASPDSASGLSRRLGWPRQRINYHLRALENAGLVEEVEQRRKGNCVERVMRATARSYLISPQVLGSLAADPSRVNDRSSTAYLIAAAARMIQDVADVYRRADLAGQPAATLALQVDVRFASDEDGSAFAEELAHQVARLAAEFHDNTAPDGRLYRFHVAGYPAATRPENGAPPHQRPEDSA
jgi:DNA-binding transcriptional ArsR family regulator